MKEWKLELKSYMIFLMFLAALRWSGVMNFLDVQHNHFPEQLQFPTSSF
jgi:hypothetical protein